MTARAFQFLAQCRLNVGRNATVTAVTAVAAVTTVAAVTDIEFIDKTVTVIIQSIADFWIRIASRPFLENGRSVGDSLAVTAGTATGNGHGAAVFSPVDGVASADISLATGEGGRVAAGLDTNLGNGIAATRCIGVITLSTLDLLIALANRSGRNAAAQC
jgi:hypothetical protein